MTHISSIIVKHLCKLSSIHITANTCCGQNTRRHRTPKNTSNHTHFKHKIFCLCYNWLLETLLLFYCIMATIRKYFHILYGSGCHSTFIFIVHIVERIFVLFLRHHINYHSLGLFSFLKHQYISIIKSVTVIVNWWWLNYVMFMT